MLIDWLIDLYLWIDWLIRSSKRARVPTVIYESQDPEMDQIMKTIKKQEEEEKKGDTPVKVRKIRLFISIVYLFQRFKYVGNRTVFNELKVGR